MSDQDQKDPQDPQDDQPAAADQTPAEEAPAGGGDKTLKCEECGANFTFTAGEQEFYTEKGFTPPKRCQDCRQAKKQARFTKVTCAECGKETEVPFAPSGDRPVYCRDCFEARRRQ